MHAELNKAGMEEWRRVNERRPEADKLAEFPGTIYIGAGLKCLFASDCTI